MLFLPDGGGDTFFLFKLLTEMCLVGKSYHFGQVAQVYFGGLKYFLFGFFYAEVVYPSVEICLIGFVYVI